jgi:hypothetical protein
MDAIQAGVMTLSEDEAHAILEALRNYLPGLNYDLARVKHERDRHHLVELERTLRALQDKIAVAVASSPPPRNEQF